MWISLASIFVFALLTATLEGQHAGVINTGSSAMSAPAGAYQYGNILFPGGIPQNPINQGHAARLGSTISGRPGYNGVGPGTVGPMQGGRNRTVVVPYAFPVFYGSQYDYGMQQAPNNVTVVVPNQPAPNVIINQSFGGEWQRTEVATAETREQPGLKVWEGAAEKTPAADKGKTAEVRPARGAVADEKPNIYLIALKDKSVRAAIGYWTEGATLHYLTPESTVNHVSLEMVDRELSERLNKERKLEFELHTPAVTR